jgi:uncharacterized coiled-coil protein SlyX
MEEKDFNTLVDTALEKINAKLTEAKEATKGDFEALQKDYEILKEEIKSWDIKSLSDNSAEAQTKIDQLHEKHGDLVDAIQKLNKAIAEKSVESISKGKKVAYNDLPKEKQIELLVKNALSSEQFEECRKGDFKRPTSKLTIADVVKNSLKY